MHLKIVMQLKMATEQLNLGEALFDNEDRHLGVSGVTAGGGGTHTPTNRQESKQTDEQTDR